MGCLCKHLVIDLQYSLDFPFNPNLLTIKSNNKNSNTSKIEPNLLSMFDMFIYCLVVVIHPGCSLGSGSAAWHGLQMESG